MAGKAPAFQFYVRDWLSDPQLRMASHSTKGIWIDLLCFMWEAPERGRLEGEPSQLAKMVGATEADFDLFLREAVTLKFADVTHCPKKVTVENRRMVREDKSRSFARLRKQRQRSHAKCPTDVTPLSSPSPSPSPSEVFKKAADEPPETEGFALPSQEQIENFSEPKIDAQINQACQQLYDQGVFKEVFAFKNKMVKLNTNPRAVLHTLGRCYLARPKDPWAYCKKVIDIEDGKYNERDFQKAQG